MSSSLIQLPAFFPFWNELSANYCSSLQSHSTPKQYKKGQLLHPYQNDCLGLILLRSGQLRAFILSDTGREVTLYRLLPGDICLFSASCILNSIQFDIHIEVEKDTDAYLLAPNVYEQLTTQSLVFANFTSQIMAARLSDVMWTLEQVLFKSMDSRLAAFLLEQATIEGTHTLTITHDEAARNLGTAREVVTRMLKYLQIEEIVSLSRGKIKIEDFEKLKQLAQ
ncbi:Crp/Fnr family transcriptional regulator [Ruminococcaceae bacterium OttesenSCG-928-A16]|nr:Crp/Fnr family transcriptional regulator [Ruminococcaceae bacterium OttesenSCG-928-A16]